ncbi:MAG: histidine phosphatase family protein [Candidatus Dormibacteraeota bacterium]|nr:histidine phosphatase family protein [Candidatus Dormibacteraeota bacterium]MBV9524362.1 histidine phosphatase family protein [Candidatus Dormibacteraeota bacterium]
MNRVFLVRHAHAGDRERWTGPDEERPLSEKGRRQADALAGLLETERLDRVVSSPALRCVQTVEALAAARGLEVEQDARLLEGHDPDDTMRLLEDAVQGESLVACTHGDLVPAVLERLAAAGLVLRDDARWSKASTWVLEAENGRWLSTRYLPPPG